MLTATILKKRASNARPNGCGADFNAGLLYGGSFPVSSVTSTPGYRNMRIGINVDAPLKKCVSEKMWRLRRGFIYTSSAASGIFPSSSARGRQLGCVANLSSALTLREAATVYSNVPNRDTGKNRIRRCLNSPLKNLYLLGRWR